MGNRYYILSYNSVNERTEILGEAYSYQEALDLFNELIYFELETYLRKATLYIVDGFRYDNGEMYVIRRYQDGSIRS